MSVASATDLTEVLPTCSYCEDYARMKHESVRFCRWHLTLFYFALELEWHD